MSQETSITDVVVVYDNVGLKGDSIIWRGAYASGTTYKPLDAVSYSGSSYIAKQVTTGNLPTNTTYWDKMADGGSGGGGAVDSVNTQTGDVVLDADDIDDTSTTKKFVTAAEKTKLSNLSGTNTGDQDLSGLVPNTRTVNGKALSSNVTLNKGDVSLGNVDNTSDENKPISNAAQSALNDKLDTSLKGAPNGVAELDGNGTVPSAQLPGYVDNVLEVANFAALPGTGETNKIYVTLNDNKTYRWGGSIYVEISPSLALGETSGSAYRGDRGKTAYDHSQETSGNPHNVTKSDVGLGNVDNTSDATKNSATATLTNKTLTSPVINTGVSGSAVDTDSTLAANSDTKLASQKATKSHVRDQLASSRLTGSVSYRTKGLDNWFTALFAATSASPIDVVYVGDSLHALGTKSTPAVPSLVEKAINQSLYLTSTSEVPSGVYAQADYSPTADTTQGTVSATALGGFGSTLTNGQVLTHNATCTGFSVAYRTDPSYGTLTIRDGAGGTVLATIDCANTAKSGRVWHSGALTAGSHTLHITSTGTTRVEIIHPNYGHKVRVWNCSHSGYKSSDYTNNAYLALDLIDTLEAAGTLKLVVIATGANDEAVGGYATDVPALIAAVAAHTSADKALWLPYVSGAMPVAEYPNARTAAYATGLPVIDSSVVAANAIGLDGTHPDLWQKRMLALQEAAILGGDPLGVMIRQIHDINRGGLLIPSPNGSGPEIGSVSSYLAPFASMPGAGFAVGDGSSAFGDTSIARKSAKKWSLNNGEGTIEANLGPAINAQTGTSYTLVLADAGKTITRSNASASTQTLPQNSDVGIPVGTIINIINLGAGLLTFAAGTGATITGLSTLSQYQVAEMTKIGTNAWNITGKAIVDPLGKSGGTVTGQTTFIVGTSGKLVLGNPGGEENFTLYKSVSDTQPILGFGQLFTNPLIGFGPGGSTPYDTTFLRIGAGQLAINTATGGGGTLRANTSPTINAQSGTSYTLVLDDSGKHITRSNASSSTQTLPQNSDAAIVVGTIIPITNLGAGSVTIQAGSGATLVGATTLTQYQRGFLTKISTNGWHCSVIGSSGGGSGDVVGPSSSVDGEVALFDSTTGKLIKRATGSGLAKLASGVLSVATAGTDYSTPSSTDTLTNKTFNANGTGNSISNLETADFASNVVDTDVALAANSDTRLATQKAIKAFVKGRTTVIAPTSGDYYSMGGQTSAGTPGITQAGKLILHPIWLDVGTIDRIAVSTSVAAVSTYRLGLYKSDPATGLPDGQTPFLDAGTVDMNATAGVQAITVSQAVTEPGLYWAAILCDAYTAQPTTHNVVYSSSSGVGILGLPQDASSLGRYRVARTYGSTVATGSLPTVPTSSMSWAGTAPRVMVRYA